MASQTQLENILIDGATMTREGDLRTAGFLYATTVAREFHGHAESTRARDLGQRWDRGEEPTESELEELRSAIKSLLPPPSPPGGNGRRRLGASGGLE